MKSIIHYPLSVFHSDPWVRKVPPHGLAFTRITLGLFLLVYAGLYIPHLTMLFSDQGLVLPLYLDRFPQLSLILAPPSPFITHSIYLVFLIAMVGITLGMFFRASVFTTIILGLYFWQLQLHLFPTSYNRILLLTLIVLFFSGAQRTFSFDQWRRSGSIFHWEEISVLPHRLIALQITATFLTVSLQKFWLPHWQGGEVLAYSFVCRWATPLAYWYINLPFTLHHYDLLVWIVKIVQPIAALGMWVPRLRWPSYIFLSGFLVMVSVMLSIWWFVFIIPASILFWDQEKVMRWFFHRSKGRILAMPVKIDKM